LLAKLGIHALFSLSICGGLLGFESFFPVNVYYYSFPSIARVIRL